jgi:hypothetical protein
MIKIFFILCLTNRVLFAINSGPWEFPDRDPHIPNFTNLCNCIKEVIGVVDAPSCFISYVWHEEGHPANKWQHKVNEYLQLAGIRTTCDINNPRGLTGSIYSYINKIPEHPSAIVLLSPEARNSIEKKTFFKEELRKIRESNVTTHYILV